MTTDNKPDNWLYAMILFLCVMLFIAIGLTIIVFS
jgi:hypothetical protein